MQEAEAELAAAKKELEEILRQLREEEVERTLGRLEGRFTNMLEREVKILEQTRALDRIIDADRNVDFEIRCGRLATEQNLVATEADRTLLLLREDGSSIAMPQTVDQMQADMRQAANRLAAARTGTLTIGLEEDIVATLNDLIAAIKEEKESQEKQKRESGPPPSGGGQPGDSPLVQKIAELRMMKSLQQRIQGRHSRYADLLEQPDDPVGRTDDPELRTSLEKLARQQENLSNIAREIVAGVAEP